tara:strand:- start:104 stop:592 length:489 start_codon:yes stop_codon:yes gene_type:complete
MKLRTKLKVKLWLLRAALVVSIASALIWTVPILHGDYTAGLTGIALSYILAILAAGFSFATKWDLENINLLIDEEVNKKIDDDLIEHTTIFKRKRTPYWKTLEQMDREHLERLIDKGAMPPAHPHPIGWRYAETSTEDPPFASTDGEGIKVNPRKLQDYLEG